MKQLTCEMCGSTELLKQDGVFVCQTCGTKYSVEEAKKMMVEVEGAVFVKNAAQLENLLNLARNSYESKNYAQAENFCNQVIAIDDKNYDAWKLKGEAINYQITSDNPRILEVYNCIMTSYRILDEQSKEDKKGEILDSLKNCFEGEIVFWLDQFEANRPTDAALTRAKNAYVDSYNKIAAAFDEFGLSESKKDYLMEFDNLFIKKSNAICTSAWKTTVGYNYYRDDFGNLGKNWGRANNWSRLVSTDTDSYRPIKDIAMTFLEEGDNLIFLLEFAEEQFNEKTLYATKKVLYDNIIYINERLCDMVYYKIDSVGYDVGWCEAGALSDTAIQSRRKTISAYKNKITENKAIDLKKEAENEFKAKKEKPLSEIKNKNAHEIFTKGFEHFNSETFEGIEALVCFEAFIDKSPNEKVGYLAKATTLCSYNWDEYENINKYDCVETIILAKDKNASPEYENYVNRLLENSENEEPVLGMVCSGIFNTDDEKTVKAVEVLLQMGADVDAIDYQGRTALFEVCAFEPHPNEVSSCRKIAKMLLDHGASINITDADGISLFNKNTDPEIARMIKEKYPDARMGASYDSSGSSSTSGSSSSGRGCYVATAVYGSYDCPEVWTLRR